MLTSTVCVALSAAGLAIAALTAYRRRYLAALRTTAWALLPVGLYMTGLVTLGSKVGKAVGDWAADLVFKPSVWAGFGVLALSVVLYAGTRLVSRRRGRGVGPAPAGGKAVTPKAADGSRAITAKDPALSDFGEIEEILKRRGI